MSDVTPDPQRPDRVPQAPAIQGAQLDALFASIAAETVDCRASWLDRLRALPTPVRVVLVLGFQAVVLAVAVGTQSPRADWTLFAPALGAVLAVGVVASAASLRSVGTASGRAASLLPWMLLLPALVALPGLWPGVEVGFYDAMPMHIGCLVRACAIAALATLPFVLLDRHGLLRRWSLLAATGSAGTIAFVVQVATCELTTLEHRVFAHGMAGIVMAGVLTAFVWGRGRVRG